MLNDRLRTQVNAFTVVCGRERESHRAIEIERNERELSGVDSAKDQGEEFYPGIVNIGQILIYRYGPSYKAYCLT